MMILQNKYKNRLKQISCSGLTLLELLLVIFILSAVSLSAIAFTNNADEQFRYDDNEVRLDSIRRSILGDDKTSFQGQRFLSGFVVENGTLPSLLDNLVNKPTGYDDYGLKSPLFDAQPGSDGFNNGSELSITWDDREKVFKGYSERYLVFPSSNNQMYRDSWGNLGSASGTSVDCPCTNLSDPCSATTIGNDKDDDNYGWCVTLDSTGSIDEFFVDSYGSEGQTGTVAGNDYSVDVSHVIKGTDWTQSVQGWTVKVTNLTGTTNIPNVGVSLLVYGFRSDGTPGWKRLSTNEAPLNDGDTVNLSFLDAGLSGVSTDVPIGQHLLVVFEDNNSTPHDGSSGETPNLAAIGNARIVQKVSFFPNVVLPDNIELIIR